MFSPWDYIQILVSFCTFVLIYRYLQINHRETHVKQKDTELATEPRKGLKSERNWASTLLSNRKGRPLVGIKKPQCSCKGSLTQTSFFIQAEAMSMSVVWTCRNASKAGIAARVTLFLMFGRTLCSQQVNRASTTGALFQIVIELLSTLKIMKAHTAQVCRINRHFHQIQQQL